MDTTHLDSPDRLLHALLRRFDRTLPERPKERAVEQSFRSGMCEAAHHVLRNTLTPVAVAMAVTDVLAAVPSVVHVATGGEAYAAQRDARQAEQLRRLRQVLDLDHSPECTPWLCVCPCPDDGCGDDACSTCNPAVEYLIHGMDRPWAPLVPNGNDGSTEVVTLLERHGIAEVRLTTRSNAQVSYRKADR